MFDASLLSGGPRQDYITKNNVKFSIKVLDGYTVFFTNEVYPPVAFSYKGVPKADDLLDIAGEILNRIGK